MLINLEYLKKLMARNSMSERQLALKTGLSSSTISRLMTGKRGAGPVTIAAIRRAFPDEPIEELFFLSK